MRRIGLRSKLFLAFGIVLLPVLALLLMGFRSNLASRQALILEDQRLTAEALAIQIDSVFDASLGLAWAVANDPLIQTLDAQRIDPHLKQLIERYPYYQQINIFDAQGVNRGFGDLTLPPEPRFSVASRVYFQSVMATNTPAISQVTQLFRPAGVIAIVAAVPIRNDAAQPIGVVAVVLTTDQLAKRYEETRLLPGQAIVLADRSGNLAVHSLRRNLTHDASDAFKDLPPLRAALAGIPTTISEFSDPVTNDVRLGAFVPAPRYGWVVGVTMPPSVALAPVYAILHDQLWVFAVMLLLSAILASGLARYLVRPFLRLNEAARALGGGDLARRVDIRTGDEIERLGDSFNEMAAQIQERDTALREREARIRRLVESNIIGIFFWDISGNITDANDAFLELTGYTREDLLAGQVRWMTMTPPEYRAVDAVAIEEIARSGTVSRYEKEFTRKDGSRIPVTLGAATFDASMATGVAFVLDLTERNRAEEALRHAHDVLERRVLERTAELKKSNERLELEVLERQRAEAVLKQRSQELARSNAELEQFAYVASHDLQEPLRMVASYMHLLEKKYKDRLDADANEFIGYAVDGAKRMHALIEDLLTYSRVGTTAKPLEPTDCSTVVQAALNSVRVALEESGAHFSCDELPTVMGDATQLTQLFQNLIANAIKFRRDQPPEIHIGAEPENELWRFSVQDNGIGIAPEYFARIFVMFQRLHGRTAYPGTGIGLAICKKIVERHGGRIWVESPGKRGSVFKFTLPRAPDKEARHELIAESSSSRDPAGGRQSGRHATDPGSVQVLQGLEPSACR
jgi:PAS domain S-box-containing protein